MRVIFAGTPEFARVALEHLLAAGFTVPLVLSQPDRPAGRGMKLQASPVKQCALEHGIAVAQPRSLRLDGKYPEDAAAAQAAIAAAQADVMVVAAYGLILPQWVLDAMNSPPGRPKANCAPPGGSEPHAFQADARPGAVGSVGARGLGCLNIHASLLPRWRGAAPIHRAIEAGDAETGVTIMQMDAGLDTGDMLLIQTLPIRPDDSTGSLHDRLATLGGHMVVEALARAAAGSLDPMPQPSEGVTYAHKIEKTEAAVDWSQPAAVVGQRIRAFNPFPGATGGLAGEVLKLWCCEIHSVVRPSDMRQGTILSATADGIDVACGSSGSGVLRITTLQRAGGKRLGAADFLRGFAVQPGMVFEGAH